MPLNVAKEVAALERMTVDELRRRYAEVFGEATNGRHKDWLKKRIAWRMQANAEGDLSERARQRAAELANDADLRVSAPRRPPQAPNDFPADATPELDRRLPLPGTLITRRYKGRQLEVKILAEGFEFEGLVHKSLSSIAKEVTGAHWNGFHFFGLRSKTKGGPA